MTVSEITLEKDLKKLAYEIGLEAYWYFYPLITMDLTRKQMTNLPAGEKPGFGPPNHFVHMRAYPGADFKAVVRPNFDTLYSSAWLDLRNGPLVISIPDSNDRYYLLPMLDMWTDVIAAPGWRTSGTQKQKLLVVPPQWTGDVPRDMQLIQATTPYLWIIGRTKTDGPDDYDSVHAFQDALEITPLEGTKTVKHVIDASVDTKTPPLETVNAFSAAEFFEYANTLLQSIAPHATDWAILARLKRIGFVAGSSFKYAQLSADVADELSRAAKDALKMMMSMTKNTGRPANGWAMNTDSMGVYGNFYFKRAIVSLVGLGANAPEDAIYPLNFADSDGKPLTGGGKYVLRFEQSQLPPVNAFWSVTMYDEAGFQVANELDRFAISSWMPLKKGSDGSVELYIQNENPGPDKESNWLPSPKSGTLGVTLRLYAPQVSALNGTWNPPAIKRQS